MKKSYKLLLGILLFAVIIAALFILPVKHWLIRILEWTQDLGTLGTIVIVACFLCRRSNAIFARLIFNNGDGFSYLRLFSGTIIVFVGGTIGACAAFLIARSFRTQVDCGQGSAESKRFRAIDHAVENIMHSK